MKFSNRIDRLERDLQPAPRHVHFEELDTQFNVIGRTDGGEPRVEMTRAELIAMLEGADRPEGVSAMQWGDEWVHYEDRLLAGDYWVVGGGTWSAGETLLDAARRCEGAE